MKVIYFSLDYSPHDHRFLSALAETDHEVFYLRLQRGPRQIEDRPVPSKIEQILWEGGQGPFRWRDVPRLTLGLRRVVKRIKPDVIHAGPIQSCAFLSILSGFQPVLTMSWGFDLMQDAERNAWWRWVTRYTLDRSTYFTSDAQATREKAITYGMNFARTTVFPWGVDLAHFLPEPREKPLGKAKGFVVFCNRSWEPRYGMDVLARAFVRAAASRPEVNLILLGSGSQGGAIRRILMNGGVLDRVYFAGQIPQPDLPRWYHMADLYVSPSHIDGSSVSLMEALACGLPCLVSDIPANREWVTEGANGWLFPDGDVEALAARILQALDQRKKLSKIGRAARQTAETRADWKKNFSRLLEAYELAVRFK